MGLTITTFEREKPYVEVNKGNKRLRLDGCRSTHTPEICTDDAVIQGLRGATEATVYSTATNPGRANTNKITNEETAEAIELASSFVQGKGFGVAANGWSDGKIIKDGGNVVGEVDKGGNEGISSNALGGQPKIKAGSSGGIEAGGTKPTGGEISYAMSIADMFGNEHLTRANVDFNPNDIEELVLIFKAVSSVGNIDSSGTQHEDIVLVFKPAAVVENKIKEGREDPPFEIQLFPDIGVPDYYGLLITNLAPVKKQDENVENSKEPEGANVNQSSGVANNKIEKGKDQPLGRVCNDEVNAKTSAGKKVGLQGKAPRKRQVEKSIPDDAEPHNNKRGYTESMIETSHDANIADKTNGFAQSESHNLRPVTKWPGMFVQIKDGPSEPKADFAGPSATNKASISIEDGGGRGGVKTKPEEITGIVNFSLTSHAGHYTNGDDGVISHYKSKFPKHNFGSSVTEVKLAAGGVVVNSQVKRKIEYHG